MEPFRIDHQVQFDKLALALEEIWSDKNPDNDPRGAWKPGDYTCNKTADERPNLYYPIIHPRTKDEIWPKRTAVWRYQQDTHLQNVKDNLVWWGKDEKNRVPAFKRFLRGMDSGEVASTWWTWDEVGHTQDAKREQQALNKDNPFSTPKPESLLERIIQIATNPGDLVLDSFAGSGTTGAVAHKMGRRWIMIELGEHCHTHILPRLQKVIDGTDQGGISAAMNWRGGGGFRYYTLAPSLLQKDKWGNWVINPQYDPAMLAEAVCKLEGFAYAPSEAAFWQHGRSTERDFVYVTTQTLTHDHLAWLSEQVGRERTLLVCCGAIRAARLEQFDNLSVKRIPQAVLDKCEYGHDDYSLKVAALPAVSLDAGRSEDLDAAPPAPAGAPTPAKARGRKRAASATQGRLLDDQT